MANIQELELLQERIGSEPVMPDALDRYRALKMLQKRPIKREGGGQLDTIKDIASKGRYGDTMLMHVNPREVRGLDSLGEMTYNPETGLPEAWLWALPLAGAAIGGIGAKLMDKDPLTGALLGGGIGLGGMGLAGSTASGLGGLFGSGTAGALPGLWQGLTPIGQGMLMGGAMGGVRGLFGQSESPMRDILVGAAMGGMGGALFGGAGGADTGADLIEGGVLGGADMATVGGTTVPSAPLKIGSATVVPSPGGAFQQGAAALNPAAIATPTSYVPVPTTTPVVHAPGFRGAEYLPYKRPTPGLGEFGQAINPAKWTSEAAKQQAIANVATDREAILKGTKAVTAGTAGTDPSKADGKTFFGGLKDWWKDREWYEKAGLAGLGAWGATELLSGREQEELEEPTPTQPFEKGERKTPLQPIQPLTEEQILAAYSGPSGTGIDTWFEPQVAKEGGLLSVAKLYSGGQLIPYEPYVQYPSYTTSFSLPSPASAPPPPPPPPEVTDPFVSNLSSFNVQDALSRITGQSAVPEQITLPTPAQLPALATAAQLPAGNIQQGSSALSDLFSRFQQAQGDPIVDLVASTGAVPETTSAKEGGIVALNAGGMFGGYTYGPGATFGKSASPGSAAATAAAKSLGLGESGQRIAGSEGWTNVGHPIVATQAVVNAGRLAANAKALAAGTLFGHKTGQALGFGLMHSSPGMFMRGVQALFGGDGPTYSAAAHAAQFSPALASFLGGGEGQTQTGEGQTQTGEGQADSGGFSLTGNRSGQFFGPTQTALPAQREGGIVGLATGGVFEGRVQGQGDGMADQVAFNVVPQTPQDIPNTPDMALLSSDEYVVPADVVSMLGNGSSTAGAQSLDKFNQLMRRKAHGTNKQQKELNAGKELSSLV